MNTFEMPEALRAQYDVSRETNLLIVRFLEELRQWSKSINLIGPAEWPHIWTRHVSDSLALARFLPPNANIFDMGSGGGFPGLIVGCVQKHHNITNTEQVGPTIKGSLHLKKNAEWRFTENRHDAHSILVESSGKKAAFLRHIASLLALPVTVIHGRCEDKISQYKPDIVTARALAPLEELLRLAEPALSGLSHGYFLKGRSHAIELTKARESWAFDSEIIQYSDEAYLVKICDLRHR